jgi:hypothetical protein
MGEQEGSKAMTVYIVVCFGLAMAALVGFKLMNDKRSELENQYISASGQFADISMGYFRNIRNFYHGESLGLYSRPDLQQQNLTHELLRDIAERRGIREGAGEANRLTVTANRPALKGPARQRYNEFSATVELRNVTQAEWMAFLQESTAATSSYAVVESLTLNRASRDFRAAAERPIQPGRDNERWTVSNLKFVWFGPAN